MIERELDPVREVSNPGLTCHQGGEAFCLDLRPPTSWTLYVSLSQEGCVQPKLELWSNYSPSFPFLGSLPAASVASSGLKSCSTRDLLTSSDSLIPEFPSPGTMDIGGRIILCWGAEGLSFAL